MNTPFSKRWITKSVKWWWTGTDCQQRGANLPRDTIQLEWLVDLIWCRIPSRRQSLSSNWLDREVDQVWAIRLVRLQNENDFRFFFHVVENVGVENNHQRQKSWSNNENLCRLNDKMKINVRLLAVVWSWCDNDNQDNAERTHDVINRIFALQSQKLNKEKVDDKQNGNQHTKWKQWRIENFVQLTFNIQHSGVLEENTSTARHCVGCHRTCY